jgi:dienelactone hydrolase
MRAEPNSFLVSNQNTLEEKPYANRHGRPLGLLVTALTLVLAGNIGAWLVKTGGGTIDVLGVSLPTQDGQWVTADLFRPKTATEKTPVPVVVVCPGFERSKETLDSYSIELARRGIAVVAIDPYSQGASSATRQKRSASTEGYGVVPMVEYIFDTPNLNFLDKTRIGATGYSAGGNAVLQSASLFGGRQGRPSRRSAAVDTSGTKSAASPERKTAGAPSKLSAVFVGGYVLTLTDAVLATVDSNVGMDYARHDEGAYRNENGNADLRTAPEALRLVNSGLKQGEKISTVEIGKIYGHASQRTMRVVYNTPGNIHPLLPYDPASIAHMIDFFVTVFDLQPGLPSANQTWWIKELFTLVSLVGALLFPVPCAGLLLRLPAFRALVHPIPPALPKPNRSGTILFWVTFAVSAGLACYLFVPLARATAVLFPAASAAQQTWWFPQRINNAVLLWAVANGAIGLPVFFLTYRFWGRQRGVSSEMLGLKTSGLELVRTLVLAFTVFAAFYVLLFASFAVFHADFRFFFVAAAADFPVKMLIVALEYLPLFFVFYLANSIRVNSASRFAGQREWVSMLIMGLGNSVGLMMILAIQYGWFASTGTVFWTTEWLYVNLLFGVIPMMFVLPYFNRYFFRMTGRVYLGPMVTCLIFIMMLLTSSVCYIPLS